MLCNMQPVFDGDPSAPRTIVPTQLSSDKTTLPYHPRALSKIYVSAIIFELIVLHCTYEKAVIALGTIPFPTAFLVFSLLMSLLEIRLQNGQ